MRKHTDDRFFLLKCFWTKVMIDKSLIDIIYILFLGASCVTYIGRVAHGTYSQKIETYTRTMSEIYAQTRRN